MPDEEEDLPEPSENLTRPEKWMAERLTPYRIFYIKRITNLILILAFVWAAFHLQGVFSQVEQLDQLIKEKGCSVLRDPATGEIRSGRTILENYNFSNSTN